MENSSRKNKRRGADFTRNVTLLAGVAAVIIIIVIGSVVTVRRNRQEASESAAETETVWETEETAQDEEDIRERKIKSARVDGYIDWSLITIPDWIERDLLPVNEYSRPGIYLDDVSGVVIHYTANPGTTAEQNRSYYEELADGDENTYVSSHFVIGMDGTIIQCIPMSEVSYASNDRNYDTISIECCHADASGEFTEETYASLVKLTAWICDIFGLDTDDVMRHYDVTGKACPLYYVEHEDEWYEFLEDVDSAM